MTEPVSNPGAEDVLASIRRLVSEDHRPPRDQRPRNGETPEPGGMSRIAAGGDRLVLTQSFRVGATDINPEGWRVDAEEEKVGRNPIVPNQPSDPTAGSRKADAEAQAPETDRVDQSGDGRSGVLMLDASVRLPDDAGTPETVFDRDDGTRARPAAEAGASEAAARIVDAESAKPVPLRSRDRHDPADAIRRGEGGKPDATGTERVGASTLGAKIAALEAVIARRDDAWEPDGIGSDDLSGTAAPALDWDGDTRRAPLRLEPEDRSDVPAAALPSDGSDPRTPVAPEEIMDEAALRELVDEIVRQELSGELGERITRNVRKLVRREIQRALIARNFD